jgi:hypothetical protein
MMKLLDQAAQHRGCHEDFLAWSQVIIFSKIYPQNTVNKCTAIHTQYMLHTLFFIIMVGYKYNNDEEIPEQCKSIYNDLKSIHIIPVVISVSSIVMKHFNTGTWLW